MIGIAATVGSGVAKSWSTLIVARAFSGIGMGSAMSIGVATVNDIFFLHEVRVPPVTNNLICVHG